MSIVIPVFNTSEAYLNRVIDSCTKQTLQDIEIVVVDDGSNETTHQKCNLIGNMDDRIKVVHKNNGGLSSARNYGVKHSIGDWIIFLDSDDWIDESTCERLLEYAKKYEADVVIGGYIKERNSLSLREPVSMGPGIYKNEACKEVQKNVLNFNANISHSWGKLFSKKFLLDNTLWHNELARQGAEDIEFTIRVFEVCKSVYITKDCFYHYVYNEESITNSYNEKNIEALLLCYKSILAFIREKSKNKNLEKLLYNRLLYSVMNIVISGFFNPKNKNSLIFKKHKLKMLMNDELIKAALKQVDEFNFSIERRIVLLFIIRGFFWGLKILGTIRYYQKSF